MFGPVLDSIAGKGKGRSKGKGRGSPVKGRGSGKARGESRGAGKDRGRDKDRTPSRRRSRQERALPTASSGCGSSGACTPGPGKNLFKCCYQRQDLTGRTFKGANLGNANFVGATLTGANLQGANLGQACLVDAVLTGAKTNSATNLGGVIYCRTQTDSGENNSGCGKGTPCCPTCDDANPCGAGQLWCKGRCVAGDCCATADCPNKACQAKTCQSNRCAYAPVRGRSGPDCQGMCCQDAEGSPVCCPAGVAACQPNGRCGCRAGDCAPGAICCGGICVAGVCCAAADCPDVACKVDKRCDGNKCRYADAANGSACAGADGRLGICCGGQCVAGGLCCVTSDCPDEICRAKRCVGKRCEQAIQPNGPGTRCSGEGQICCGACCTSPEVCDTRPEQDACCIPPGRNQTCGAVADDCGQEVDCGACAERTCQDGVCDETDPRCEYSPVGDGRQGPGCRGEGESCCNGSNCCASGQICTGDGCCTPNPNVCQGKCGVVIDNCQRQVDCGACAAVSCRTVACADNICQVSGSQPDRTGCTTAGGQAGICCGDECLAGTCCASAN